MAAMAKSGVPDWFGKGGPETPEPPRRSGGPRGTLVGVVAVSLALLGAGVWFASAQAPAPPSDDSVEPGATGAQRPDPKRDMMLEEISKTAGDPAQAPDPSELPSIDEIIEAADLPAEDGDDEPELTARSPKSVMAVVRSLTPQTRACYQQDGTGKVEVTFTIDPEGRVSKAEHSATGTLPKRVGQCIEGVLQRAEFGPASEATTVKMPFAFGS